MTLHEISKRLNGSVNGPWLNIRGPNHSTVDRSLGILFDPAAPDGFVINSFAGDDPAQCRAYVKALLGSINGEILQDFEPAPNGNEDCSARIERAMALWAEAKAHTGTIVEDYLRSRRCAEAIGGTDVIRFHPNCPFKTSKVPAMLALITDVITGTPIGVHRTAIRDDGSGKRFGDDSKRMLGVARGAVQLQPASAHLGIAEGIETALSAMHVFKTPVWATLSRGGIAKFPVLPWIKLLTVFADHDPPGMTAAATCCRRYNAAGIDAEIRPPTQPGTDWNEFISKGKV